jgi:hypothetical protein
MQHVTDKHAINTSQPPMNKHEVIHHCFLEHDVVMFGRNLPTLRRNLLPSFSGTSWLNFIRETCSLNLQVGRVKKGQQILRNAGRDLPNYTAPHPRRQ